MSDSVELIKKIVALKPGGEVREQQEVAVAEIEEAITTDTNLLLEAPTGSGKALDIETPILTTVGWKTMGTLSVGDYVYDETGLPTEVVDVLDEFESSKTFVIRFSDNSEIVSDSDHLWSVRALQGTETTPVDDALLRQVKEKTLSLLNPDGVSRTDVRELAKAISYPMEAVEAAAAEVTPLEKDGDNWVYDGEALLEAMYKHFLGRTITRTTEEISNGYLDPEGKSLWGILAPSVVQFDNKTPLPAPARLFGQWLAGTENVFYPQHYNELEKAGIKDNKVIPEVYLYSSVVQRKELLIGLLEGSTVGIFRTTLPDLANSVKLLANSLGLHCTEEISFNESDILVLNLTIEERPYIEIVDVKDVSSRKVRCITVAADSHLYLAGKTLVPTHNTLSYLTPLAVTGAKAVISTATKQLSEQIFDTDIPFFKEAWKKTGSTEKFEAALLKGRDNYLCLAKMEEMNKLERDAANSLFGSEEIIESRASDEGKTKGAESSSIIKWAEYTKTGDRSQAPVVSDETWRQYSSTNTECPGKNTCPFGDICFSEAARDKAKNAQVVVTNHAIVAQDLASEGKLLGDREVFVFDELHELDNYLSSAWGAELSSKRLRDAHKLFKTQSVLTESAIKDIAECADNFPTVLRSMEEGLIDNEDTPRTLGTLLTKLYNATSRLSADAGRELKQAEGEAMKRILSGVKKIADELNEVAINLNNDSIENVRWVVDKTNAWKKPAPIRKGVKAKKTAEPVVAAEDARTLHAAPLRIGPKLQGFLDERDAIMVGTSATITIGRRFEIPLHNFGLDKKKHKTVELDSPFDYKKQAMLYVPAPGSFPEPTGADRREHTEAVLRETPIFVKAAGGRALLLSTTSNGASAMAEAVRKTKPKFEVLAQGEAPNAQLVKKFKEDETSILAGTMGFWHGIDAPGKTLSLVIIDKLPFMNFNDPLALARRNYADKIGRNGFMDVFVAHAETMFRQAFGRANRSRSDLAVIVAFEPRLLTKPYGRGILNNLHGVGLYHDKEKVLEALKRLADR